jgi:hypothetical protein
MVRRAFLSNLQPFWTNPVIVRDMRVRMRGTRAFWNQAAYLGLLSCIAVFGYSISTKLDNGTQIDPISVQRQLQQFYYFIFMTLAGLITIIAPALTAASIVSERKLQTFDLLVTTPMTAMQMLTGKLISTIAFIVLLLVLSIPASALCIILGGSTISDVMQSYAILLIDGVLLSAIGLSFSCSAKQHINAIMATYGAIILLFIVCMALFSISAAAFFTGGAGGHSAGPALLAFIDLIPFCGAVAPGMSVGIFGLTIPAWVATAIVATVLIRLILSGAALRLGMYGPGLTASFRRQILLLTLIGLFIVGQSLVLFFHIPVQIGGYTTDIIGQITFVITGTAVLALSTFFLPALFVPVADEDGPPDQVVQGRFNVLKSFSADHSGAFVYFEIWLFVALASIVAGIVCPSGASLAMSRFGGMMRSSSSSINLIPLVMVAIYCYIYFSGMGFLYWSIARRAAWLANSSAMAKTISFLLFAFIMALPFAVLGLQMQAMGSDSPNPFTHGLLRFFWLLYPYTTSAASHKIAFAWSAFSLYGAAAALLGVVIYPFWLNVVPGAVGAGRKRSKKTAKAA